MYKLNRIQKDEWKTKKQYDNEEKSKEFHRPDWPRNSDNLPEEIPSRKRSGSDDSGIDIYQSYKRKKQYNVPLQPPYKEQRVLDLPSNMQNLKHSVVNLAKIYLDLDEAHVQLTSIKRKAENLEDATFLKENKKEEDDLKQQVKKFER